jgi:uncharacterized damage-inducible protein DinB
MPKRFLDASRAYLLDEYLPKIRIALNPLTEADIWWRPVEGSNSIGNLLLHIDGNCRQWLIAGVGGRVDARDRDAEFAAREGRTKGQLIDQLTSCFVQADSVLSNLNAARLDEPRIIQGHSTTVFAAIYHVVEHVSMHTGQIIQLAKWRAPGVIRLYEATSTSFTPLWTPTVRDETGHE